MTESRPRAAIRTVLRVAFDVLRCLTAVCRSHAQLAAENLFPRKQLALYVERQMKPRRADDATRIALVALSWLIDWRRLLTVVKPEPLIRWHQKGFRLFWRWKSTPRGRPRVPGNLQRLIAEMAAANRTRIAFGAGAAVAALAVLRELLHARVEVVRVVPEKDRQLSDPPPCPCSYTIT